MRIDWRAIHARHSVLRELILEQQLTASLLRRLWQRGVFDVEVLHSAFDAGGYDLVLTGRTITLHMQLKASRIGGRTRSQTVSLALARRSAGCVLWMDTDDELNIRGYRLFQPEGTFKDDYDVARHTRGDATGLRRERREHRIVPAAKFNKIDDLDTLLDALLGSDAWPDSSV